MAFPVVAARFCARHRTAFTVTKTGWPWRPDLTVTDASGAEVMQVEGSSFFSLFHRSHLLDAESRPVLTVEHAESRPVLTVERSPSLFEISRRWEAFRGDSTSSKDLLFAAVVQPSLTNTGDIDVRLAGEEIRLDDAAQERTRALERSRAGNKTYKY